MQALSLVAGSKAILINKDNVACDLNGNALGLGFAPLPIYRDQFTAKTFVRVTEVIPSGPSPIDVAAAEGIKALKPTFYTSPDGDIRGYFVEAPDFNGREGK